MGTPKRRPLVTCPYCLSIDVDYKITNSYTKRETYRCMSCYLLFEDDPEEEQ